MCPPQLPAWLHIGEQSISGILYSLRHWDAGLHCKTVRGILDYHDIKQPKTFASNVMEDPGNASAYRDNINQRREEERQDVEGAIGAMQDQDVISSAEPHMTEPLPTDPKRHAEWLKLAKSVLVDIMLDPDGMGPGSPLEFLEEGSWYEFTKAHLPPFILRPRHDSFEELWGQIRGLKNTRLSKQSVKKVCLSKIMLPLSHRSIISPFYRSTHTYGKHGSPILRSLYKNIHFLKHFLEHHTNIVCCRIAFMSEKSDTPE